jgi:hypothetical protein
MPSSQTRPLPLAEAPNQHARPSGVRLLPGEAELFGYQEFSVTRDTLRVSKVDRQLARKAELLDAVMQPSCLAGRTIVDLGANNGYFSLLALRRGARHATAVDLDPDCTANLQAARDHLGLAHLDVVRANVAEWTQPADCVVALALSHWLCNCTAEFGSLAAMVGYLAALTRYLAVVEFVDASDPAIARFGHLTSGGQTVQGYSRETFEAGLRDHFPRVECLGEMSGTRALFAVYKTADEIDLSGPLPLMFPRERLLSCKCLAKLDGVRHWSAVFDAGAAIVKQTTGTLALHEARVLASLQGAGVPRVLGTHQAEHWSSVSLEKIEAVRLDAARHTLAANRPRFVRFVHGCLDLLETLRHANVVHRDIYIQNVLLRDGLPVLIDFGWASSPESTIEPPARIHSRRRAMAEPDASPEHCDVRDMGRLLLDLSAGRHPDLETLFGVMAEPAASLRIVDLGRLRGWLRMLEGASADDGMGQEALGEEALDQQGLDQQGLRQLLDLAEGRRRRLRRNEALADAEWLADLYARLESAIADGSALTPLGERESRHVLAYAQRLRAHGQHDRASAVGACLMRSFH